MEHASSGSGCASVTSLSGTNVAWTTTWNWAGGGIKGYTNMQLNDGVNKRLLDITSIPVSRSLSSDQATDSRVY
jgi:xyloglucan-specific endo-beta-1,4-glucanase